MDQKKQGKRVELILFIIEGRNIVIQKTIMAMKYFQNS